MNTDFDFDNIGKRTPYRTPEGFFDEVQRHVWEQTSGKQRKKRRVMRLVSTLVAMAAVLTAFLFIPTFYPPSDDIVSTGTDVLAVGKSGEVSSEPSATDKWIKELSDEELEELVHLSQNDPFLHQ